MNDDVKKMQTQRLALKLANNPTQELPPRLQARLELTDQEIAAMRAQTWVPVNPTAVAVQAALAPVQAAAESARTALEAFVADPQGANTDATVQAIAQIAIAIANLDPSA